jgi:hypothetical protein
MDQEARWHNMNFDLEKNQDANQEVYETLN